MKTVQNFRIKANKRGGDRHYWEPSAALRREGWTSLRLSDNRAEAIAEAEARNAKVQAWREETGGADIPRAPIAPDSVKAMIVAYQDSRFWRRLKPRTQKDYQYYLDRIDAWCGDSRATDITPPVVEAHYEALLESGKTHAANAHMRVVRLLFAAGRRKGFVMYNPASELGMVEAGRNVQPVIWTDAHVDAMVEAADAAGRHSIGTAILLNCWLGQRREDVLKIKRNAIRDGKIYVTQNKTGAEIELPVEVVPHLVARIEAETARSAKRPDATARIGQGGAVDPGALIVSENTGRQYTGDNFYHLFADIREKALEAHPELPELDGLRFAWLRHTAVTRMAEAGSDLHEIAAITGHTLKTVAEIIEHYLVRTGKMARSAFEKRVAAMEKARAVGGGGRRPGTFAADDD